MNWLAQRAAISPDRDALLFDGEMASFGELDGRVEVFGRKLTDAGLKAGDRIVLAARPSLSWVIALHSIWRLGAAVVPVDPALSDNEISEAMRLTSAHTIVSDRQGADLATIWDGKVAVSSASENLLLVMGEKSSVDGSTDVGWMSTQCMMFTSGTTGAPKTVLLSGANHWWNAFGSLLNLGSEPDDMWLDCMPLHHVGGLAILIRSVLYGVPVWLQAGFDVADVNAALDSGLVTLVSLVGTMLTRLIHARNDAPFHPNLRCILLGGGPIAASLVDKCAAMEAPIAPTYGATEMASQAATLRPELVADHPGSVGLPLMGIDIEINGDAAESGGIGEVMVSGPSIAGWTGNSHQTGDVGSIDRDGFLHVLDRRGDLVLTGGENVRPSEVETVLRMHPAVRDVVVVGIPDDEWGQVVGAAIVLQSQSFSKEDIEEFCRQRLPGYKRPKVICFIRELPRTKFGKVNRSQLRQTMASAPRDETHGDAGW